MSTKDNVLSIVEAAKGPPRKPNQKRSGGGGGNGGGKSFTPTETFSDYAVINGCFYHLKPSRAEEGGKIQIKLCDFTARIDQEVVYSDGLKDKNMLQLIVTRYDGLVMVPELIPSAQVLAKTCTWVAEHFGARLILQPGNSVGDQLRSCIQQYSRINGDIPRKTVYCHTGWRKIENEWCYLSSSGALSATGLNTEVQVDLNDEVLNGYRLPAPLQGDALKAAGQLIFDLINICPHKRHIGVTMLSALARAPLCEAFEANYMLFFHGASGSYKSTLALILLNFFGVFSKPTASWRDTKAAIPKRSFVCKDVPFLIDDYKLLGDRNADQELKKTSNSLIQAIGDGVGRNRLSADSGDTKAFHHRGMVISTGEHIPENKAHVGRNVIIELTKGDADIKTIKKLQNAGNKGQLDGLMSAYIQWLAAKLDGYKTTARSEGAFQKLVEQYRDEVMHCAYTQSHGRAASNYANMVGSIEIFLNFLTESGIVAIEQHEAVLQQWQRYLQAAFFEQAEYQADSDETERFLTLLRAVFSEGNAHISDVIGMKQPEPNPYTWGWRKTDIQGIVASHDAYSPQGNCIGYYYAKGKEVWLVQASAYAAVQSLARKNGEELTGKARLWREMRNRGLIKEFMPDRTTFQKKIAGIPTWVMVLSEDVILGAEISKTQGDL